MKIEFRTYQTRGKRMLYDAFREGYKKVCWVFPTGAGKSTVCSSFVSDCSAAQKKVAFIVHSEELVRQFSERLYKQFNILSGVVMAGVKSDFSYNVQVCSLMTLVRRKLPFVPDVLIIDECHRAKANSYKKIIERYPDARLVGLTATPFRGDGKGLGDIFETIVHPVKISELIRLGYLVPTKVYLPSQAISMKGVKVKLGDYDNAEMFEKFDKKNIYDSVVENYLKFCNGKKAITFNVNVEHSKKMNEAFLTAGISSYHLDGTTPKAERRQAVKRFAKGEIMVLHNCSLFTEGFDIPDVEAVIVNRSTKSKGLWLQIVGRGLRPAKNKEYCIVLDFGGNVLKHGLVEDYDEEDFNLNGKQKNKGDAPLKKCPVCGRINYARAAVCLDCEHVFVIADKKTSIKDIELQVLDKDKLYLKRLYKKRWNKLKPYELRAYAKIRGFKKGWVYHFAIDNEIVKADKDDPRSYQKVNFQLSLLEMQSAKFQLLEKIKNDEYQYNE